MTDSLFPQPPDTRLAEIHAILLERYGSVYKPRVVWDPLKQFIYSLLSSRTKTEVSHQVMRDLEARFGTWENVRDASLDEIGRVI